MTPLCHILRQYAAQNTARFHMPGHKGGNLPLEELSAAAPLDVTEIPGTGNLYCPGEPFDAAQRLWAYVNYYHQVSKFKKYLPHGDAS